MSALPVWFGEVDLAAVRVLLCDADGCLLPSEEPAFEASTEVTNRLLEQLGVAKCFTAPELQRRAVGKNFRATSAGLARDFGAHLAEDELERWVAEEREQVIAHLSRTLRPDPRVEEPLAALAGEGLELAVVSSSALARLDACFRATELDALLPPERRYSAEDSLPQPTSKPDPAVYVHAGRELGVAGAEALAVEDSVTGATSAVAAGFPTVGMVQFVSEAERPARVEALRQAGVAGVVASWGELAEALRRQRVLLA